MENISVLFPEPMSFRTIVNCSKNFQKIKSPFFGRSDFSIFKNNVYLRPKRKNVSLNNKDYV
ncbi:MAG TPA: hypothetical protein DCX03_10985 [Bacteroidales bacterium]|nr:hypothetical protein [Bacteroidales bacterium]